MSGSYRQTPKKYNHKRAQLRSITTKLATVNHLYLAKEIGMKLSSSERERESMCTCVMTREKEKRKREEESAINNVEK